MQQHHAVLQAVDNQRRARHVQLSTLGYSQLVEGFNNVSVSPRRWTGQANGQHGKGASSSRLAGPRSTSGNDIGNGMNRPTHHQKGRNLAASAHPKGKGKSRDLAHTPIGDFVAATEDPAEEKRKKQLRIEAFGDVYDPQEETLRNDLSLNYLNTGRRPQNMLQGCELKHRFEEYPKLHKLLTLHSDLVRQHACPATYLQAELQTYQLQDLLPTRFDCILMDPPLEEYARDYPGRVNSTKPFWTWEELAALPIPQIAANPGFIWLWVGSGGADDKGVSGLDKGRELLAKWGYRRCEDIVWLKTNKRRPDLANEPPTRTILTHTKEHCLMGIRGTVRRSTDGHFVHCNIDTDVIVSEPEETDPLQKPLEIYQMIENFCLGTRRVEIFGTRRNCRPGWLTIGEEELDHSVKNAGQEGPYSNLPAEPTKEQVTHPEVYDKEAFDSYFLSELRRTGANLVPTTADVDDLRPRSPGGANKAPNPIMPGMKSNPQGIGRHTNRAATPSASQALEYGRLQAQFQEQFVRQQHQQQMLDFERQRQEEMLQQQALIMQQMSMMGMPGTMQGMPIGMNNFGQGFQPNQMIPIGQAAWQVPVGMNGALTQGHFQGSSNGQPQYQQQSPMQQGPYNVGMHGMFPAYQGGF